MPDPLEKEELMSGIFPVAFFFHRYPYRRGPMIAAVCVLQAALFIFMKVEVFTAMIVARFLQGAASSVVFSGECPWFFWRVMLMT